MVSVSRCYRKAIMCADALAALGSRQEDLFYIIVLVDFSSLLHANVIGVFTP